MIVLEELDNSKKGFSEVARNARQASRFLDELIQNCRIGLIYFGHSQIDLIVSSWKFFFFVE